MKVRQEVYDNYWKFAAERQEVFYKRIKNLPSPWTNDPILKTFKFCNVYRASDRVSQFLIKDVIYYGDYNEEDTIFRILLFKIFNKIETWQYLQEVLGDVKISTFNISRYAELLNDFRNAGYAIYTSAYMSCANKAFGYNKKHENHLALIKKMVIDDKIINLIQKSSTMRDVYELLLSYPLIGKFMAYQLATDINYSAVTNFSERSFTMAGPGAKRGIKKCFESIKGKSEEYIINWMADRQEKEFERLGLNFKNLWGRPLQNIDCQGLFCEVDKYSREAFPELKSNRKRIKARFKKDPNKIEYFFPPKWGINEKVQKMLEEYKIEEPITQQVQLSLKL